MLLVNDNDSQQETPLSDELAFQTPPPIPLDNRFWKKEAKFNATISFLIIPPKIYSRVFFDVHEHSLTCICIFYLLFIFRNHHQIQCNNVSN